MARFVLTYPDEADLGRAFELPAYPVVVGRAPECAIRIDRESISRHHARIYESSDGWCVEDMESTNGCFVNDKPVHRAVLRDADFLKIGVAILRLDLTGDTWRPPDGEGGGESSPAVAHATLATKPRA